MRPLYEKVKGFCHGEYDKQLRVVGCKEDGFPFFRRIPNDPAAHFFHVYDFLFTDLGIKFPFSPFYCEVINYINAVLVQLHPDAWAFM